MSALTADDFIRYFKALHGFEPFPWQRRLAADLLDMESERPRIPELLDIPTGLGKTSVIDLALFFLAARPDHAPRRILYVIDRRIVVDQAADRARDILTKLMNARDGILFEVARALRELFGGNDDEAPFEVSVMRGGMPRDEAWARRPDRPVVVLGTVDQVGSRLLFRGYGVSPSMAPVHAGLLGTDALFLLDEVQLSTAFADTLASIARRYRRVDELGELGKRWAVVQMSATPITEDARSRFGLSGEDLAHPIVHKRLSAKKIARLLPPIQTSRSNPERSRESIVKAFAAALNQTLSSGSMRIAIIVNRVDSALAIHRELKRTLEGRCDLALLTGRMRPLDRDALLLDSADEAKGGANLLSKLAASDEREALIRPLVVVSTQTLEAGADFDFEALITECASLDALRQRFGRLDRRGISGESEAMILIQKDQAAAGYIDPIYGEALSATWAFLNEIADEERVDLGITGFAERVARDNGGSLEEMVNRGALASPIKRAPILLPAHLDALAETQPRSEPGPDPALYLHGPQRGTPEVRIIWRADIDADALGDEASREQHLNYIRASLAIAPTSSLESLSVPLSAFRAFIERSKEQSSLADVEGADEALTETTRERERARTPRASRPFILVEPKGLRLASDARQAYPEATIVLPSSYGGLRDSNWDPEAREPVSDLGDEAQLIHRGKPVLRLVPALFSARGLGESLVAHLPELTDVDALELSPREMVHEFLDKAAAKLPRHLKRAAELLLEKRSQLRAIDLGESGFLAATSPIRIERSAQQEAQGSTIVNDDADGGSFLGREIALDEHLGNVRRWVSRFAQQLALPEELRRDLELAGRLHDIGKADPRFQQLLRGGVQPRAGSSSLLLAKSTGEAGDRAAREAARSRAGYPRGYRHEMLSVAMLEREDRALEEAHDRELVLHLVGSHHGWGRPFAPPAPVGEIALAQLELDGVEYRSETNHGLASWGSSIAERFWLLNERYGWWTLAFLETLLRLADHRASEEESEQDHTRKRISAAAESGEEGVSS